MLSHAINLAIADDHALFRKTLRNYLSDQKNLRVTIQAADVFDLLEKLKSFPADVLLMDVFMPGMTVNDALRVIRTHYPALKLLILSMNSDIGLISTMMEIGIHGYISKSDEPEELLRAIQCVAEDRIYRNRLLTEALYYNKQNAIRVSIADEQAAVLSEREKKILQLIWQEKSNKEMADELFLGVRSIEKIRQDLKEKLGVRSTVGLLKYAISKGIIPSGSPAPFFLVKTEMEIGASTKL